MKTTTVALLCAVSGLVAGVAGIYGGIYLDRRAGDAYGANLHANEIATHLKVASAVSVLLAKNDACGAQKLLGKAIDSSKSAIHDTRTVRSLEQVTLARLDEAIALAAKAESAASAGTRCG